MECEACKLPIAECSKRPVTILDKVFVLCARCAFDARTMLESRVQQLAINMTWGGGKITFGCWHFIRDLLREFGIKEVLEIGTGISSELFINEGIKLTSLDSLEYHVNQFKINKHFSRYAEFIYYKDSLHIPDLGRKWDFVFVDSPNERSNEVKYAMEISNRFIFLHDPNLGEESFFPNDQWIQVRHKLYEKKGMISAKQLKIWQESLKNSGDTDNG